MDCQICFESFSDMYKVTCASTVEHMICFDCETKWRAKMPIRDGARVMTCPTCRQPETDRTMDSLQRELSALYVSRPVRPQEVTLRDAVRVITSLNEDSRHFFALRLLCPTQYQGVVPAEITLEAARTRSAQTQAAQAAAQAAIQANQAPSRTQAAQAPVRPRQQFCASGRDCRTRSRLHTRTKTHMKCRVCQTVACCANCRFCVTCETV